MAELPRVGDYISIHRSDQKEPYGEDLIVRHIWWRLETLETRTMVPVGEERAGTVREILLECDKALGPYSSDNWRDELEPARQRGEIGVFDLERYSVRESELPAGIQPDNSPSESSAGSS